MNIKSLKVGMVIKNYKELCNLLGVEMKKSGSNSRIYQHKDFERYFDYEKQGHKYIIKNIYDGPKEKTSKRGGGNNRIFIDDFKKLMICMLHEKKSEQIFISKSNIYKAMNLVNDNYLNARNKIPKLSDIIEVPQEDIYEFYEINSNKLRDTVERGLKALRRECLLIFETVISVAVEEVYDVVIVDGEYQSMKKLIHRQATAHEKQLILELERETLKKMNCSNLQGVFLSGKWRKFKKEVERKLKKENTGIIFYYDSYMITWNKSDIENEYEKLINEVDIKTVRGNINNNMVKSINRSSKSRHTKAKRSKELKITVNNIPSLRLSNEYIHNQKQLTYTLIDDRSEIISL